MCERAWCARTHTVCAYLGVYTLDFDYGAYNIVLFSLAVCVVISKKSRINVVLGPIKSSNARKI